MDVKLKEREEERNMDRRNKKSKERYNEGKFE